MNSINKIILKIKSFFGSCMDGIDYLEEYIKDLYYESLTILLLAFGFMICSICHVFYSGTNIYLSRIAFSFATVFFYQLQSTKDILSGDTFYTIKEIIYYVGALFYLVGLARIWIKTIFEIVT
jgi:hypothetical protein